MLGSALIQWPGVLWPCLLTAVAVLAGGIVQLAQHLARGPPRSRGFCARIRARWFAAHVREWLSCTGTFDGLLAARLEFEKLDPDGTVRARFTPSGPLLSRDGVVHEGALALLTDTVTSIGQTAAGHLSGLSIEIGLDVHQPVPVDERLVVTTRILKVHPGAIMSMEMELRTEAASANGEEGKLLASGWHTKSMKAPFKARLWHGFAVRCLPFYIWELKNGLEQTKVWAATQDQQGSVEQASMEALLAVRREENHDAWPGVTVLMADVNQRLQNLYGISHGAATAALLAAAAREHAKSLHRNPEVPLLRRFSTLYQHPVPGGVPIALVVWKEDPKPGRPEEEGTVNLGAELHLQDWTMAKANFAFTLRELPEPAPPPSPWGDEEEAQATENPEVEEDPGVDEEQEQAQATEKPEVEEDPGVDEEQEQAQATEKPEVEEDPGVDEEQEWMKCWREGRMPD